ncbi:hypothetical protein C4565_02840 [Candidatus Parcubacteria bacterium]|nr:MAG: hypothetical protein C4565_02840 [Candidatus Parcubacteria bacterium]
MSEAYRLQSKEIDLFDFFGIILQRKGMIFTFVTISILTALIYSYVTIYSIPSNYLIKAVIRIPLDNELNTKVFYQLNGWFSSGAYEPEIRETLKLANIPEIRTKIHADTFAELSINYPDPIIGKQILKGGIEALQKSAFLRNHISQSKQILDNRKSSAEVELVALRDQYDNIKHRILEYDKRLTYNIEKLSSLEHELNTTGSLLEKRLNNEQKSESYFKLVATIRDQFNSFILHVNQDIALIKNLIYIENRYLSELNTKISHKQRDVDYVNEQMNELINPYTIESPPQPILLPSNKKERIMRIMLYGLIVGIFAGAFFSLLLGIKERRYRE